MKRAAAVVAAAVALGSLALVQRGAAGPGSLGALFFGPKLVRAEVVLAEGGTLHDYRIDRGRIRSAGAGRVSLLERDGTTVDVPLAPDRRRPRRRAEGAGQPAPPDDRPRGDDRA